MLDNEEVVNTPINEVEIPRDKKGKPLTISTFIFIGVVLFIFFIDLIFFSLFMHAKALKAEGSEEGTYKALSMIYGIIFFIVSEAVTFIANAVCLIVEICNLKLTKNNPKYHRIAGIQVIISLCILLAVIILLVISVW